MDVNELLEQARTAHQGGQLPRAEALYRQVIQAEPAHPVACYLLGVACHGLAKMEDAERALREAVRLRPTHPEACNHLGVVCLLLGKFEEAVARFQQVLQQQPDFADARKNLARTRESVAVQQCAAALNDQGAALEEQGRFDEAGNLYQRAYVLQPETALYAKNLGVVLGKLGRFEEALALLRRALALQPEFAEAHLALGAAQHKLGRRVEAFHAYQNAIRIKPELVSAHSNLGDLLVKAGEMDAAIESYRRAIALRPEFAPAHNNLGIVLSELGKLDEAIASFRHALRLKPNFLDAQSNLLKGLNYHPKSTHATLLDEHRHWQTIYGPTAVVGPAPGHDRTPDRPLRVGYVSPDFRIHAVSYFFEPILAHHDRRRVEPICYAEVASGDSMTARLQELAAGWRVTTTLSDTQLTEQIRRDRIDILVDLAGHTSGNRLGVFLRKPAPIQMTYLGYPNTTGLTTIDYLLTDALVDPPGEPTWSTEEPYRLPGVFCCYTPAPDAPDVAAPPEARLGHVTFGSLHKLSKLNESVLDLWCELLRAVPSARLLLFRNNLTGSRRDDLRRHFQRQGIADDRVEMRHAKEGGSHLPVYHSVDISLDVFPWCGHTTACESLWMGVPVITLSGDRHAGRMTASVLHSLGLADWVAHSPADYIAIGQRMASDPAALAQLRGALRDRMRQSPVCDGKTWTAGLEDAYRELWHRWCNR